VLGRGLQQGPVDEHFRHNPDVDYCQRMSFILAGLSSHARGMDSCAATVDASGMPRWKNWRVVQPRPRSSLKGASCHRGVFAATDHVVWLHGVERSCFVALSRRGGSHRLARHWDGIILARSAVGGRFLVARSPAREIATRVSGLTEPRQRVFRTWPASSFLCALDHANAGSL